jgi:hypothetical protein
VSAPRPPRPLPCGTDPGMLVAQVADGVRPDDRRREHQAGCPHCTATLADLRRLWDVMGELAAERVTAPAALDAVIMGRVRRALFLSAVARLFEGLLPRFGLALLVYSGLVTPADPNQGGSTP